MIVKISDEGKNQAKKDYFLQNNYLKCKLIKEYKLRTRIFLVILKIYSKYSLNLSKSNL